MKKVFNYQLEALRGFCALMVFVHHAIIYSDKFNGGWDFRKNFIPYSPSGHLMVLIFFMLSGYVIGLNYAGKKEFDTKDYLWKRLLRLYPIYLVAIALTIVFFAEPIKNILSVVFFTQNILTPNLDHNLALWSLNHEVVYYLAAIPILKFKIKVEYVIALLAIALGFSLFKFPFAAIVEGYLVGFIFWLTGFAVSKIKKNELFPSGYSIDKFVGLFFLLLAGDFLNTSGVIFSKIKMLHQGGKLGLDGIVSASDFGLYFLALFAIFTATAAKVKWYKILTAIVFLSCWSHVVILIANGSFTKVNFLYTPTIFLAIGTFLFFSPFKIFKSVQFFIYTGSISYALYVIHMPLLYALSKVSFFAGSLTSFFVRTAILSVCVYAIAHFLEKRVQPKIKKYFSSSKSHNVLETATVSVK